MDSARGEQAATKMGSRRMKRLGDGVGGEGYGRKRRSSAFLE